MSVIKARILRRRLTNAERKFWYLVRDRRLEGFKFRRQIAIGPYVADFACFEAMLIVEIDGGQHAQSETDISRTIWLNDRGWRVLRFWNNQVLQQIDAVAEHLLEILKDIAINSPSPVPSKDGTTSPTGRGNSFPQANDA